MNARWIGFGLLLCGCIESNPQPSPAGEDVGWGYDKLDGAQASDTTSELVGGDSAANPDTTDTTATLDSTDTTFTDAQEVTSNPDVPDVFDPEDIVPPTDTLETLEDVGVDTPCVPDCQPGMCVDGCGGTCTCDDANPCTDDICLETGSCSYAAAPNGTPCDGVGFCQSGCVDGSCAETAIEICNDGADNDCDDLIDYQDGDCPSLAKRVGLGHAMAISLKDEYRTQVIPLAAAAGAKYTALYLKDQPILGACQGKTGHS